MDLLAILALLALILPSLYLYTVSVVQMRFPSLRNKRICLLIAHPDDEAMFFAPTVLALTRPETGNHVKILCLSNGNADGLGEIRKTELIKSGMTLGLRKEDDMFVLESEDFPDSMTATWDANRITTIDVLITFDGRGVSGHPNHISLYHGARRFVSALVRGRSGWEPPVDLYTLRSVPMWRKYTGFLDCVMTLGTWAATTDMKNKKHPRGLVFLSGLGSPGVMTAWKAMVTAHKSQMVWFRWGWILLSRYMVMNDLNLEKISAA